MKFKTGFLERKKAQILSNSTCSADLSCTDKTTKTRNKHFPQVGLSLDKKLRSKNLLSSVFWQQISHMAWAMFLSSLIRKRVHCDSITVHITTTGIFRPVVRGGFRGVGGGRPLPSGIQPSADSKGPPFVLFSNIHFW